MIRLSDRISTVLARDERLLEVLIGAAPVFDKLRNPLLRKTMAKLTTVEQAARVAGIDAVDLLERLDRGLDGQSREPPPPAPRSASAAPRETLPALVTDTAPQRIVDVDVREDLRAGREPFARILGAAGRMRDGEVLRLRRCSSPRQLYAVLGRQGFGHYVEQLGPEDWRVWFHRSDVAASEKPAPPMSAGSATAEVVVLDVRGLEPPEPMVRTLEALQRLPRGKTLVHINVRVPQFLLPRSSPSGASSTRFASSPRTWSVCSSVATPHPEETHAQRQHTLHRARHPRRPTERQASDHLPHVRRAPVRRGVHANQ